MCDPEKAAVVDAQIPAQEPKDEDAERFIRLCDWRKRFRWCMSPSFTEDMAIAKIELLQFWLPEILAVMRGIKDTTLVPDAGETADGEKAALASLLDDAGETLAGIAIALMIREDNFFQTQGIPDGPPTEVDVVTAASPIPGAMSGSAPAGVQ